MFRTLALAFALATASLCAAATPAAAAPAQSALADDAAAVNGYLLAGQQAVNEATALAQLTIQGMNEAVRYGMTPSKQIEAKAWGDRWETEVRARAAAVRTWRSRAPAFPRAAIQRSSPASLAAYEQMPGRIDALVGGMADFAESVIKPARAASTGDPEAPRALGAAFFRASSLILTGENELLDITIASLAPSHPQRALARSMQLSNEGLMLYLQYMEATTNGEESDRARLSAGIRAKAEAAATQARASAATAKVAIGQIRGLDDPVKPRLLTMMATYEESARVEVEIAAIVGSLAEIVEKGVLTTSESQNGMAGIQPLVDRRLSLHTQRIKALQGS